MGERCKIMLFRREKKAAVVEKRDIPTIADMKSLIVGNNTFSYNEKLAFYNVIKCMETHEHPLARRTGITQKDYMADLCRYCNWLIMETFDLHQTFKSVNRDRLREYGYVPVNLLIEEIKVANGNIVDSGCCSFKETKDWCCYGYFKEYSREAMLEKYGKNLFNCLEALVVINDHFVPLIF